MESTNTNVNPNSTSSSQSLQMRIFTWSIRNKRYIFWTIRLGYAFILTIYLLAAYAAFTRSDSYFSIYYDWGLTFGRSAIVFLGVAVLPGILGRFGINWQVTRIITFFRRQVGITVFLLAFSHYSVIRNLPVLSGQVPFVFPYSLFEMFGFTAFCILFLMYITSNNWSMAKLGPWWKRLHRFVYVVLWLLVLHTALQRISLWSGLIIIFAAIETASLIYLWVKNKNKVPPQAATPQV